MSSVKRDSCNYRGDGRDIKWIQSFNRLKSCGISNPEMKEYLALRRQRKGSIPERRVILAAEKAALLRTAEELRQAVDYVEWKRSFYNDVIAVRSPRKKKAAYIPAGIFPPAT